MAKVTRIAVRVDSSMNKFLQSEAERLDISVGQYIRQVVKEKQNEQCYENENKGKTVQSVHKI